MSMALYSGINRYNSLSIGVRTYRRSRYHSCDVNLASNSARPLHSSFQGSPPCRPLHSCPTASRAPPATNKQSPFVVLQSRRLKWRLANATSSNSSRTEDNESEAGDPELTASSDASASTDRLQVVISGIGPAGLLLAHYLLERGEGRYHVRMCDRGPDPREAAKGEFTRNRYSFSLYVRGLLALKGVEGLLPRVMAAGSLSSVTVIYNSAGKVIEMVAYGESMPDFIKDRGEEHKQQLVVDRMEMSAVMLEELVERHGSSGLLEVAFGRACVDVDLRARHVTTSTAGDGVEGQERATWQYDVLVGADGVGSAVRNALAQNSRDFDFSLTAFFGDRRRMKFRRPEGIEPMSTHLFPSLPGVPELWAVILPDRASLGTMSLSLVWHNNKPPLQFLAIRDVVEMRKWVREHLPMLADVADESLADLLEPSTARPRAIKCNRYHDSDARAALVGDAAHATFPMLAQGCNAALVGSSVLARLLLGENVDATTKRPEFASSSKLDPTPRSLSVHDLRTRLPSILERYSALQVKDGHAVVDICTAYDCLDEGERSRTTIYNFLLNKVATLLYPRVPFSFSGSVITTTEPYGDIYATHKQQIRRLNEASQRLIDEWREGQIEKTLRGGGS